MDISRIIVPRSAAPSSVSSSSKSLHLFNGAGVKGGVVVLLVEGLLDEGAGAGDKGRGWGFGGDVSSGVQGSHVVGRCLGCDHWSWDWRCDRRLGSGRLPVEFFRSNADRLMGWLRVKLGRGLVEALLVRFGAGLESKARE